MPPMYWSAAIQYFARSSTMHSSWSGQAKRMKYQDESTNVSMVSVSRFAALRHFGHLQFTNDGVLASGLPVPSGTRFSGRTTGSSSSGTGTSPQASQWTIGVGVPQYGWREMPQTRRRPV